MDKKINDDLKIQTIRPSILPDDRLVLIGWIIFLVILISIEIWLDFSVLTILITFLGFGFPLILPILFHTILHFCIKLKIYNDRLILVDYFPESLVKRGKKQEMFFRDIHYIYYLDKEGSFLLNLKDKLKDFNIPLNETDYRKSKLIDKYNIPANLINEFYKNAQESISQLSAASVIWALYDIFDIYSIPKKVQRNLMRDLNRNSDLFNYDYIRSSLSQYIINSDDWNNLKDAFAQIHTNVLDPFLITRINFKKYAEAKKPSIYGEIRAQRIGYDLVLSNNDGTKKMYMMSAESAFSKKDIPQIITTIYQKNPNVQYLMTKKEIRNIGQSPYHIKANPGHPVSIIYRRIRTKKQKK